MCRLVMPVFAQSSTREQSSKVSIWIYGKAEGGGVKACQVKIYTCIEEYSYKRVIHAWEKAIGQGTQYKVFVPEIAGFSV